MRTIARHQVRRTRERARHETAAAHAVLDAGFLALVGFCVGDQPFLMPLRHARDDGALPLPPSARRSQGETA